MSRKFFLNLIFLVVINVLIKPFYLFGIDRNVQNIVGAREYGMYWALFNFIFLFQVINDLGLQNFTSTFVGQNRNNAQKYLTHLAILKGGASLVFLVLVVTLAWAIGYRQWSLILPLCASQIFVSFTFFLRATLSGLGFYRTDSILSVMDKGIMILIWGWLIWGGTALSINIDIFVYTQLIATLVTFLVATILVLTKSQSKWSWNVTTLRVLLRKSAPFALTFILTTLFTRMDVVMVERMLSDGQYQAGVYAAGYRLLDAANMMAFLFVSLLLPMFSNMYKDRTKVISLLSTSATLMWVLVISLGITSAVYSDDIMGLMYINSNLQWTQTAQWLMLSYIPMGLSYISGALLLANHRVKKLNYIYGIAVGVNLALNLLFIPKWGARGAAMATFFTQTAVTILTYLLIWKQLNLFVHRSDLKKMTIYLIIVLGSIYFAKTYLQQTSWMMQGAGLGLFFAVIAIVMKMVPFYLFKNRRLE